MKRYTGIVREDLTGQALERVDLWSNKQWRVLEWQPSEAQAQNKGQARRATQAGARVVATVQAFMGGW